MDIFGSILGSIFIALLVGTALTFGLVLILWFIGLGVALSLFIMLRQWWWRWRFLHNGGQPKPGRTEIIEAEYREITEDKK